MIDNFALALSHGLIALTVWVLLHRPDLDHEETLRGVRERKTKGRPRA